jgi:hypothetical protein
LRKYLKENITGKPRVFSVKSVGEFIEIATWLYSDDHVIYRGQTKEKDWALVPSVGRNNHSTRIPWREREILNEFKREAIPFLDFVPDNDWQWLALAQHNRLPTRLIDWTTNPLVALWFAVKDPAIENLPCVVWAYHYDEDSDVVFNTKDFPSPFSIEKTHVYFPEHIFPYIRAQSGVFTVHHSEENRPVKFLPLEESEYSDLCLSKIEILPDAFASVRYHLFRVGIHPATLFPGLSGVVDKIRYDNIMSSDEGITETE